MPTRATRPHPTPAKRTKVPTIAGHAAGRIALRSKVTSQGQTTLPSGLRRALGLRAGVDEIEYVIQGDHAVIRRAAPVDAREEDPALCGFLDLIERDIAMHGATGRLRTIPRSLFRRIARATAGVDIRPDESIDGEVAL